MKGFRTFIICMIIMASVVITTGYYMSSNQKEENLVEIERDLNENNKDYKEFIESEISQIGVLVESYGKIFSNNALLPGDKLAEIFELVNEKEGSISSMYFVYDTDGSSVDSGGKSNITDSGSDLRSSSWYTDAAASDEVVISDVYNDTDDEDPLITISYAVWQDDELQGVLAADIYLETLYDNLEEINTWKNTYNYVIDSNGTILLHQSEELLGYSFTNITEEQLDELDITEEYFNDNCLSVWNNDISNNDKGIIEYSNFSNYEEFGVFDKISDTDWTVVSAYNYDDINHATLKYDLLIVALGLLIIIVFGGILYYFMVWSELRDSVTKTYNIMKFQEIIKKRTKNNKTCILLYIDLRNLTGINNEFGLSGGDKVLSKYSKILKRLVKKDGVLATTRNKNFIFIFNDNDWNNASEFTLDLNAKLNELAITVNKKGVTTESFLGLSSLCFDEKKEVQQYIEDVEEIFVELKKTEGNSPLICSDFNELMEAKSAEIKLKNELLKALEEDRVIPFFQPIYNIKSKKANKYEVLMRIKDGDKLLAPYPYILIAEKYNIIQTVDYTVITKALEYKKINDQNDEIQLSVNISGKLIQDREFLQKLVDKIDELDIKHSNIIFEITETHNIDELFKLTDLVDEFKRAGFKFSIDDFGTGYSSMSYLKNIKANYLKIDGSFIKDINTNKESYYVVEAIINMAKAFNTETVAEFIENQEIEDILKEMNIDYGQGYFFGKPGENFDFHK